MQLVQKTVRMNEFAKSLGKILKRPSIFKVPEFATENFSW